MISGSSNRIQVDVFADHEVIIPVNKLKNAVAKVTLAGDDPLAKAEAALAQLSGEFASWMSAECDRLDAARHKVRDAGLNTSTFNELFHAAHDIKGDAATFGFALAAGAAESLCRVLEHSPVPARIPMALVDQHVDAVRAIVREYARPDINDIATALVRKLRHVSDEFLIHENRHRPDYLQDLV
ncbi:Hpt domain-containing protein [Pseudorhodoplanes sp.]|uniref:Hpt domain-containing protein n=1 Tax=Pseudorhodoplanes sp. TaxID=1934341 RepID=UPI002BFE4930|nr:Hpt domain-containing protein [Pseudorhodoplanes sp.]HWV41559.1 Hpt domain-containing protein [Pseudorhodoplanes sp.]